MIQTRHMSLLASTVFALSILSSGCGHSGDAVPPSTHFDAAAARKDIENNPKIPSDVKQRMLANMSGAAQPPPPGVDPGVPARPK